MLLGCYFYLTLLVFRPIEWGRALRVCCHLLCWGVLRIGVCNFVGRLLLR